MSAVFGHLLDSARTRYFAAAVSLTLGLIFTFLWAPHPWPREGIDQYHDLARAIARGEGFGTTDVPWGYAYYIAVFYELFGVRPVLPILGQVIANAAMPLLLFALVQPLAGRRTANLSALLVGVFSFNTVYASTQISDALCSVIFLAAIVLFARGHAAGHVGPFAASGILAGLTPQFRPNLLLLPALAGGLYLLWTWRRRLRHVAVFLALSTLMLVPWVVRNYYLAGVFLPTSSHGGIQLWYGSLQVGRYLENYSANPRTAFAAPVFNYSSLAGQPIVAAVTLNDCAGAAPVAFEYWTDRNANPVRLAPSAVGRVTQFAIPGQADPTVVYSRVVVPDATSPTSIFYISSDHMGDLDRRGEWLDIFDVVRLIQHLAWPSLDTPAPAVDANGNGSIERADLDVLVTHLLDAPPRGLTPDQERAVLQLADGSHVAVPRSFARSITDLAVEGTLARRLISASTRRAPAESVSAPSGACEPIERVTMNEVFYRRELHLMRRYTALAFDNIRREPAAFAAAASYRALRLFVVRPAGDLATTYQFAWGRAVYGSALVLSLAVFLVFLAGVFVAWRQRSALLPLLVPIAYVPATICFVLTNQRYTVTVQPLMFAFMALALITFFRWDTDADR